MTSNDQEIKINALGDPSQSLQTFDLLDLQQFTREWSESGEGTFVIKSQPGGKGYKAQNNTQSIITDPDTVSRFQSELISEHMAARVQKPKNGAGDTQKKGKAQSV
jgi:hypothetical protein